MNFKSILSKSSLRSSTSSGKSLNKINEIKKLHDEIESLKLNISSLKVLLEGRDAAIGNLAREKEKLYVEHKNQQRINRKIQQELVDERIIHSKEKDFLLKNMKKLSLKLINSGDSDDLMDEEEHIISALQNEIKSKDEVIFNVCSKYFKLRKSKEELQKNFKELRIYTHETFETIIETLEDNKNSLDSLLDELIKSAKSNQSHKKIIQLLKINTDLNFENTQLKLFLIAKNDFQCSQKINQLEDDKNLHRQKAMPSVENFYRRSKTSASRVVGVLSKLKNINLFTKYNRKIRYRSMSDTFLPRNFYK